MSDTNAPVTPRASPAERLAALVAEITVRAKAEARAEIDPAEDELAEALVDFARAEARMLRAATTVRELQDLLGDVAHGDLVMTVEEIDAHNGELYLDERVEPMVFGHSLNSNP